jgi:Protein of unknown function (DUF2793)
MTTSPVFGLPYIAASQAAPEVTHNAALNMAQILAAGFVQATQNTPPVSPTEGQVWIVGTVPTGAWVGHANQLAGWFGGAWLFVPGVSSAGSIIAMSASHSGLQVYDVGAAVTKRWNGTAWV